MNSSLPSLNALRAFEAVARHLHYPAAAEELNVSPAAVKQLIGKLESSVGAKLIVRDGRGLALTHTGSASLQDLSSAMSLIKSSVQKMREQKSLKRLIVSVEASLATAWLVPKLQEFRMLYPDIAVLIDSSQEIVDLARSDVDVAIRYGVDNDNSLVTQRLFDDQIFPACSPSLMKGSNRIATPADLARVPLIHWDLSKLTWAKNTVKWFSWETWLQRSDGDATAMDGGLRFSDYGLAVQAAIAGQGVVLASWPILKDVLSAGQLVRPFNEVVRTDTGYDIVTTELNSNRQEVEVFTSWIMKVAGQV